MASTAAEMKGRSSLNEELLDEPKFRNQPPSFI
jgi:hypothetical protein